MILSQISSMYFVLALFTSRLSSLFSLLCDLVFPSVFHFLQHFQCPWFPSRLLQLPTLYSNISRNMFYFSPYFQFAESYLHVPDVVSSRPNCKLQPKFHKRLVWQ
uniref:Putative secreted protein n=1 Tax=Xenopsylla cheopis TaxID=163159 RepID=A0A6M2DX50_XENCH